MAALLSHGFTQEEVNGTGRRVGYRGAAARRAANGNHSSCSTSRTAQRFAKAWHEAETEVQTKAASSKSQGQSCPRAAPAARCHCSCPPCGWGQLLFQPGVCSIGQMRKEAASESLVKSLFMRAVCRTELSEHTRARIRLPGALKVETGHSQRVDSSALQTPARVPTRLWWFSVVWASEEEGRNCSSCLEVPPRGGRADARSFPGR